MKYLIFTDMHMAYTSSILPLHKENSIYTYRLQMCIDTLKWIFDKALELKVDKMIFAGDLFDAHSLKAEEITALSEALKYYDNKIPMIIITGNHDILDTESNFYSSSIFNTFDNVKVYNKPQVIDDEISVLPYMKASDISYDLIKPLKNKILISHIDMQGSHLRPDYQMESGIDPELFTGSFVRVFNGHIHTAEELNTVVQNIGSCTSISFSDSNSYISSILIYDSDSNTCERLLNYNVPIFRTVKCKSVSEFITFYNKLSKDFKYILKVKTDYQLRETLSEFINSLEDSNILTYRIITDIKNCTSKDLMINTISIDYSNIDKEFKNFLSLEDTQLKYPLNLYKDIINELEE